jgi:hypothetical protein
MRSVIGVAVATVLASAVAAQTGPAVGGTPQGAVASAPPPAAKLRCKRYVETGSLARMTRVCHTAAEWDQLQRQGRVQGEAYQQSGAPPRID